MTYYDGNELNALKEACNYYSWMFHEFSIFMTGRILEVGAGIGVFSKYLSRLPIKQLVCLEPSFNLVPLLQQNINGNPVSIVSQDLEQFSFSNQYPFDTVVCVNVLEHIKDDIRALLIMNDLLKSNGKLCLFVPAMPYLYGSLDKSFKHYRRYSRRGIELILVNAGFQVIKSKYFHLAGILTWLLMGKVLQWKSWDPTIVKFYDRIITPIISKIETNIPPPIGQSLLLVG